MNTGAGRADQAPPPGWRAPLSRELACAARAIGALVTGRALSAALDEAIAAESAASSGASSGVEPLPHASQAAIRDLAWRSCRQLGLVRELARALNARTPAPATAALQWVALAQLVESVRADAILIDQAVRAAHDLPGGSAVAGFLNATLRRFAREREARLAAARRKPEARWNHPDWWIERLRQAYPQRWEAILEAGNGSAPMTLRINRLRIRVDDYLASLRAAGIDARRIGEQAIALDTPMPVDRLPGWRDGVLSVQDAAAQLAAPLLAARDGERTLDACAAPGGKTTHLLELADTELTALDIDEVRLRAVRENLERAGFAQPADGFPDSGRPHAGSVARPSVAPRLIAGDACRPADWWDGRPFDRILLDAPCTASGIVRRHPDVRWLRRRSDLATLPQRQSELLGALWPVLRPGGKLLYATCSVFPEEGESVITRFLKRCPDATRVPLQWSFDGIVAEPVSMLLPVATPKRDHDGFFFALLEKRS